MTDHINYKITSISQQLCVKETIYSKSYIVSSVLTWLVISP